MKTKIKILIILSWLVWALPGLAQDKPHFIRALGGVSLPMGVYSKTEDEKKGGDYAQLGWSAGLEGAYFWHKNWGVGLQALWTEHSIDRAGMEAVCLPRFGEYYFFFDPQKYKMQTVLAGLYYHSSLNNWLSLEANASAGLVQGTQPLIIWQAINNPANAGLGATENTKQAFAYQVSLGVTGRISRHWQANLKAMYSGSKPKFEYVSPIPRLQAQNYTVMYLNLMLGIQYVF